MFDGPATGPWRHQMTIAEASEGAALFALWLGVLLIVAKIAAELVERFLGQPAVVGELLAGVIIGPFALGAVELPLIGPLFPATPTGSMPVPEPLWVLGQAAAVLLLFGAGLETNIGNLVRYGRAAVFVALGGVVLPFALGAATAVATGIAPNVLSPAALFIGAVLTATSVGVTARVLSDIGKLDSPEGVTIMGAAVIDDVIGVIVLAVVVALPATGALSPVDVSVIVITTVGLWLAITLSLIVLATTADRLIRAFRAPGAAVAVAVGLALLSGFLAESIGLAMIIGSYSAGLALSRTGLRADLENDLRAVQHVVVPAFFVSMGMLVDLQAMVPVLGVGVALSVVAAIGKVVGCGIPARLTGFNALGAMRIGVGMLPRGEVALIVAGVGLGAGVISESVFSLAVFVAVATTVAAPVFLGRLFLGDRPGRRDIAQSAGAKGSIIATIDAAFAPILERHVIDAAAAAGFEPVATWSDQHGSRWTEFRRSAELINLELAWVTSDDVGVRIETETSGPILAAIVRAACGSATGAATRAFDLTLGSQPGSRGLGYLPRK